MEKETPATIRGATKEVENEKVRKEDIWNKYVEQPREWEMKSLKDQKTKEMDQKTHGSKVAENQPNLEGHK